VTKEGRLFWSLPKRPPQEQVFDQKNTIHRDFIAAYACLQANMYGIKNPFESPRSEEARSKMAEFASTVEVKEFKANEAKAREIASQVDKEQNKQSDEEEEPVVAEEKTPVEKPEEKQIDTTKTYTPTIETAEDLKNAFKSKVQSEKVPQLQVEEFEKDEDTNYHIDFIYAAANVRALNYSLAEMDWITVKLKAGRIVPALATTTAAIAGLQTIELLKLIKRGTDV